MRIHVQAERTYSVVVGCNWQEELIELITSHQKVLFIVPAELASHVEKFINSHSLTHVSFFSTPSGESQKSISVLEKLWEQCAEISLGRLDALVGFGGGATTDLAGFAAASWLRGVQWYAVPTTLAGMVDASVGGKTGINAEAGKNLIGAFHSPSAVLIDATFLDTLSDRDFNAGMAEVIKTGLIEDSSILDLCESTSSLRSVAIKLIAKSIHVKARVVSADFQEGKLREILNFGHTFGHAVEKQSKYSLRHGEAVAIGVIYALRLSESLAQLPSSVTSRVISLFKRLDLPTTLPSEYAQWDELLISMQGDKKSRNSILRFIGLTEIGKPVWFEGVSVEESKSAYETILA